MEPNDWVCVGWSWKWESEPGLGGRETEITITLNHTTLENTENEIREWIAEEVRDNETPQDLDTCIERVQSSEYRR